MLFAGLGLVRWVKNCGLGLENAALGLQPQAAFSRPRSQFFTIQTSQPANNIYICSGILQVLVIKKEVVCQLFMPWWRTDNFG